MDTDPFKKRSSYRYLHLQPLFMFLALVRPISAFVRQLISSQKKLTQSLFVLSVLAGASALPSHSFGKDITNHCLLFIDEVSDPLFAFPFHWKSLLEKSYQETRVKLIDADTRVMLTSNFLFTSWTQRQSNRSTYGHGLAERFKASEDHAVWLEKLGYQLGKRADGKDVLIAPENIRLIFERSNKYVNEAIARGEINENDTIRLALPFVSKDGKEHLFVRPGIDLWPFSGQYTADFSSSKQLSHKTWEQAMAEGKMPFFAGNIFMDHDLGHYTEYLSQLETMKATRNFYRQVVTWPDALRSAYEKKHHEPIEPFMLRVYFFAEAFAVPNVLKSDKIKSVLPHLFRTSELSSLKDEVNRLSQLETSDLLAEVERLLNSYNDVLLRQGGSSRDSYNYVRLATDDLNEAVVDHPLIEGLHSYKALSDPLLDITTQNLLNTQYEIQMIVLKLRECGGCSSELVQKITDLLVDRLARVHVAFANGIKLKIRPAQVIRDSGQIVTDPNSVTSQWLSTFVLPQTALWKAFLSPESQAPPSRYNP